MKRITGFVLVLGLLMIAGGAQAQASPAPLVMLLNGADLWQSFPAGQYPVRLTTSGNTDRPYLSPDGVHIAYKVIADIGIEALKQTGGLVSELPSDLEVRDLGARGSLRIVTQPAGATFVAGQPSNAIVRSAPAWSPDGRRLAWTEDVSPGDVRRLMLYDLAGGTSAILAADMPLQNGFQQTLPARWGAGGIALLSSTQDPANPANPPIETLLIYGDDGKLRASAQSKPAAGEYLYDFEWIDDGGADRLGIVYSTGRWEVVDPATGAISPLNGVPQLYSTSNPNGLALDFGVTNLPGQGAVFTWTVVIPGAPSIPLTFTGPIEWITISPVGDSLAYADGGVAYVWRDGQATAVNGTNPTDLSAAEMVWGPTAWRSHAPG